ncbi:nuclear transport factor 2 family protein [Haladaptatus sp. DFWS20]|uniref:nuclear transport factor 2 family protein n=1 Tax=Haladaptatus sp. DFWS20 TaxID=3403467 RepID=UPI003EB9AB88
MATTRQSNVEIVQTIYESFNEGDIESALATMADDVEWIEPEGFVFGGTYHSPDEVLENVFMPAKEEFETFRVEPDRFIDGGDTVVTVGTFHATNEAGDTMESPFAHVNDLRDGRVIRFENYTDTALWQ